MRKKRLPEEKNGAEEEMNSGRSQMRHGYTTGTCAAAAAKAAAWMLLTGHQTDRIRLQWQPVKDQYAEVEFALEDAEFSPDSVRCAVRKDAGDDIDVTDGLLIYAKVSRMPEEAGKTENEPNVMESMSVAEETVLQEPLPELSTETRNAEESFKETETKGEPERADEASGQEQEDLSQAHPMTLSDLEDENGVIPLRWDKVADFFAPKPQKEKPGKRFITLNDNGEFTESEWALMQELFQAAGNPEEDKMPLSPEKYRPLTEQERFPIHGGEGIGTVTKPGLDQPPGEAAINSGPRRMIREAVGSVCDAFEYEGNLEIEISVPGGQEIAEKTFNPRLGIKGGISILGTTGIVEPMSGRAVSETVRAEIRVKAASSKFLSLVPGNTGADFVRQELLIPEEKIVIMSNYPGDALDEAQAAGVERILLTGSLGKMIKLAGGIFHTHSRDADARMDILMRCALQAGSPAWVLRRMDSCVTTEAGLLLLEQIGLLDSTMEIVLDRAVNSARHRAEGLQVEMVILRNSGEVLAFTDEAFGIA